MRVLLTPSKTIRVGAEVVAGCPREFAFHTYMKIREYYLQLNPDHKKYELSGTDLVRDVLIDVEEEAGFQFVRHQYRIAEFIPNELMTLISEKSRVKVFGLFKSQSRSEVEFRFSSSSENETVLRLTIRIIFTNQLRHFLARLFFTETIWRHHARKEMVALAGIIEQSYSTGHA